MNIKVNPVLEYAAEKLYSAIKDADYGSKFSWDELECLGGFKKGEVKRSQLYIVVAKVCLLLMVNDKKYLYTVHGFGKRIIEPIEHSVVAKNKVKRSVKIYRKAGEVLGSTNMDCLSSDEQKQIIHEANKYRTLQTFTNELLNKKKVGHSTDDSRDLAGFFLDAIKLMSDDGG